MGKKAATKKAAKTDKIETYYLADSKKALTPFVIKAYEALKEFELHKNVSKAADDLVDRFDKTKDFTDALTITGLLVSMVARETQKNS